MRSQYARNPLHLEDRRSVRPCKQRGRESGVSAAEQP